MGYTIHEKLNDLSWFIKTKYRPKEEESDIQVNEAELTWNASGFLSNILYHAEQLKYEITLNDFEVFKLKYQEEKTITINTEKLFEDFWLRQVLGFVEIPYVISSTFYHFTKLQSFKNYYPFIYGFYKKLDVKNRTVDKAEFIQALTDYCNENDFKVQEDKLFEAFSGSISVKGDKLEFGDIDHYLKPLFDNWNELEFIYSLNESFKNDRSLLILKKHLDEIHSSYRNFFVNTPTIQAFIEGGLLKDIGEYYAINFYGALPSYWFHLGDKISARYWELLVNDTTFLSDTDRVKHFLSEVKYWGQPSCDLDNVTENSKNRFLKAAFELVINESDVDGLGSEFLKVSVDNRNGNFSNFIHFGDSIKSEFTINNADLFELSASLDLWEKKSFDTMFFEGSRDKLATLIRLIVRHEPHQTGNIKYKRIKELIRASLNKPSILGFVIHGINFWRKEALPYLLEDIEFVPLCFRLIFKFESPYRSDNAIIQEKLLSDTMDIALITIKSESHNSKEAAKTIFQLFRQLNRKKYEVPYNKSKKDKESITEYKRKTEEILLTKIENCTKAGVAIYNGSSESLIPFLLNDLINCFANYTETPYYNNGVITMPLLQLDGIIWLMRCSTLWKYKIQGTLNKPDIALLSNKFLSLYREGIEVEEIKKYDSIEKKEELGLPLWAEKVERLSYLEWIYPIYFLFEQQQLSLFISPKLDLERTTVKYHKKNQFVVDKLRTHLGVLLEVLGAFTLPAIPYSFESKNLKKIKKQIENKIIGILELHSVDAPEDGRIDLLDYKNESAYNMSNENALLPQLSKIINWFDDKEAIVNALTGTNNIIKTLTILEWVTSEGIRKMLLAKIKQSDLQSFLEDSRWVPEIQTILLKMTRYGELMEKAKEIVEFWESNMPKKVKNYANTLYQTKLLIAYYNNSETELDLVSEPDGPEIKSSQEISHKEHKEFFRALIQIKNNSESAYTSNNNLCNKYPGLPVFAINRMAAKMNIADKTGKPELYREAWEEWLDYETKNKDMDTEDLGVSFIANKLLILLKLNEFDTLAQQYNQLNLAYRMIPEILESRLESLITLTKFEEAENLLSEAELYHKFASETGLEIIKEFRRRISGIDDTGRLRNYYERIFNCRPDKLVQIFPDKFNGKRDLYEFITCEIGLAASKMLDKIKSISDINSENKYNDVIQILLQMRMSQWGWFVGDQGRKGSTTAGLELGEIDIDFFDSNNKPIVTCEAFILRNPKRVSEHLEKLIGKYTHNRKSLITLVYYVGEHIAFKTEWDKYRETTIPALTYPVGYELKTDKVIDRTKHFGYEETGIKIGHTLHGDNTSVYHIFVNINYEAERT
jgi:hypothetical protein